MKTLYKKLVLLVRDEQGTEVVEWTLVGGLVVIAAAAAWAAIGGNVQTVIGALQTATGSAASSAGGS